ncbi:MAG: ATP-binding protein [Polyangiaceae bacterium]
MSTFIGRQTIIERIESLLGEGQHVSVVAPKSMGKTRLLQAVVARANTGSGPFVSAGLVDFRHNPPTSMAGALARVGETLETAYAAAPDLGFLANEIDTSATSEELYDQLKIAVDMVAEMSQRVLLVLDGCDAVLQNATIEEPLGQPKSPGSVAVTRLMTGTRDQLVNLCYNPDARTSGLLSDLLGRADSVRSAIPTSMRSTSLTGAAGTAPPAKARKLDRRSS